MFLADHPIIRGFESSDWDSGTLEQCAELADARSRRLVLTLMHHAMQEVVQCRRALLEAHAMVPWLARLLVGALGGAGLRSKDYTAQTDMEAVCRSPNPTLDIISQFS